MGLTVLMIPSLHLPIWLCHGKLGVGYAADPGYSYKGYSGPVLACCELPPPPPVYLPDMAPYSSFAEDVALSVHLTASPAHPTLLLSGENSSILPLEFWLCH